MVFTPGKQAAAAAIAGEESLGVIQLHELAEDTGTRELLTRAVLECGEPRAERWLAVLEARYEAMIRKAAESGLDLEIEANPRRISVKAEPAASRD